jgi:putative lipoic acid-binding regulatory protein
MADKDYCMQFPCSYPLKVMGLNTDEFKSAVISVVRRHTDIAQATSSSQLSRTGKYLSITVTFIAQSRPQLDALYQELNDHELVLMTL